MGATDALISGGGAVQSPSALETTAHRMGPPDHYEGRARPRPRYLGVAAPLEAIVLLEIVRPAHLERGRGNIAAKECEFGLHGSPLGCSPPTGSERRGGQAAKPGPRSPDGWRRGQSRLTD